MTGKPFLTDFIARWQSSGAAERANYQLFLIETPEDEPAATTGAPRKAARRPWPKSLPEQASALRAALAAQTEVVSAEDLARGFTRARTDTIANLLQTLVSLGLAREVSPGRFVV